MIRRKMLSVDSFAGRPVHLSQAMTMIRDV